MKKDDDITILTIYKWMKQKGDTKAILDRLQSYLLLYTLFQSDRKYSDGDSEV